MSDHGLPLNSQRSAVWLHLERLQPGTMPDGMRIVVVPVIEQESGARAWCIFAWDGAQLGSLMGGPFPVKTHPDKASLGIALDERIIALPGLDAIVEWARTEASRAKGPRSWIRQLGRAWTSWRYRKHWRSPG